MNDVSYNFFLIKSSESSYMEDFGKYGYNSRILNGLRTSNTIEVTLDGG